MSTTFKHAPYGIYYKGACFVIETSGLNLEEIAEKYQADIFQILLSCCIKKEETIAIPQSSTFVHVLSNVQAAEIQLTQQD